jgi:hypothetical protein
MENLHLLGSIASIISPIGIVFWKIIKKKEMSPFNRYMLIILLIQAIFIGVWLLNGKILNAVILAGICFMFTILPWLIMHLYDRLLGVIESQIDITASIIKSIEESDQIMKEIIQNMEGLAECLKDTIENFNDFSITQSIRIDTKTEQLDDKLKKLQKKIGTKKSTK